jgi:hypothetical protein
VTPKQNRSAGPKRPIGPAVGKKAIHGKETVPELPITIEITRRPGQDDLAIGLQCNRNRPFFRVDAEPLTNEATPSEVPIQPPAPVEASNGDLAADSTADDHATASLCCHTARSVVATEGGEDTPAVAKGRVKRSGSCRSGDAGKGCKRERCRQREPATSSVC